jgi:peptidoglycan hydrolase-like protein with peptidoglycan-binding domain
MDPQSDFGAPAPPRRTRWLVFLLSAVLAVAAIPAVAGGATGGSSPGAYKSSNSETLRPGDSGPAVKRLQKRLKVRASGYYGPKTKRAVKRFQRRHHLKANGIANAKTLRKLGLTARSADSNGSVKLPAELKKIAQCESGGNPRAVSPDGTYRGKYQFDQSTWEAWGGKGDPAKASERTQDRLALRLYRARGTAPWPNCA